MRIGISIIMAGRSAGGPETYEVQMLRSLAALDHENEYFVYVTGAYAIDAIRVQQANFHYRVLKPSIRPLSQCTTLPIWMVRDRLDFYHATFTPPPFSATPLILTAHCLSSMVHPEYYRPFTALRLNYLLRRGIRSARRILCVSDTTRQQVHQMFQVPLDIMQVTYNGVDSRFGPSLHPEETASKLRCAGIDGPYILYLGKIQKHKNVGRLLEAYQQYRTVSKAPLPLVLAGREQGASAPVAEIINRLELGPYIKRLGYVPNDLVPELYRGAHAFVFPSLWEGFGIPVVEAMASGTPVITSSATSLPEIAGNAALVVNPESPGEIAAALLRLESEPGLRDNLIRKGQERAKVFSWRTCAASTLDAYRSLGEELSSRAATHSLGRESASSK